jgi:hypothetical protein
MTIQTIDNGVTLYVFRTAVNANFAELSTLLAGKYAKPSTGIPATDLAAAVQTLLVKAESASQPVGASNTKNLVLPSGVAWLNASDQLRTATVSGGTVTAVALATASAPTTYVTQGATSGAFAVAPGAQIKITWSAQPSVVLS